MLHLLKSRQFSFFGGVGGAGGGASDLENWLTAKKNPGYLPDFYHIFCNTIKTYPSWVPETRGFGLRPTPKIPAAREKNLWYPG